MNYFLLVASFLISFLIATWLLKKKSTIEVTNRLSDPDDSPFPKGMGYVEQKKLKEAEEQFQETIRLDPDHALGNLMIGWLHFNEQRYQQALPFLEKANQLNPEEANANYLLGKTYFELERNEEALPPLENAIRLDPSHADSHFILGYVHSKLGDSDKGEKEFQKAVDLNPSLKANLFQLTEPLLKMMQDIDEGVKP
jgi:tetratricopeptide (TPR) repeat protein